MLLSVSEEEGILSTVSQISHIRQIPLLGFKINQKSKKLLAAIVTKGDLG